jgi:hypothetical protein
MNVPGRYKTEPQRAGSNNTVLNETLFSPRLAMQMKPLTLERGFDNVPLGQVYRTPYGATAGDYEAATE